MAPRFTARALVCFALVLSLWAPGFALSAPENGRDRATEVRDLAIPSSAVQLTRAGALHDYGRQRPSAPSLFTLLLQEVGQFDRGRLAAAGERDLPPCNWIAGPRTGRSPPVIS